MHKQLHFKRLTAFAVVVASLIALLSSSLVSTSSASMSSQLQANQSAAAQLKTEIAQESQAISKSAGAVASAKVRLAAEQASLNTHVAELKQVQLKLMHARDHLLVLEKKLRLASNDLAANLVSLYENGTPSLVDVVLQSSGFQNLLQQVSYLKRSQTEDTQVVNYTRKARNAVLTYADQLGALEQRDRKLTDDIIAQRNRVAAIEAALTKQQIAQEQRRDRAQSKLKNVDSSISSLQAKIEAARRAREARIRAQQAKLAAQEAAATRQAEQTPTQVNQSAGGIAIDTGGMVQAPADAPEAVKRMIAAGNAIATLPYIWGGGHASFQAAGYDCSGSVSYVLAAAGLLSSPLTSEGFASYGDAGPGKWVTLYVDPGVHVWMTIDGWRFDTVALAEDGTRWAQGGGEFAGFEERHPPGL